MNIDLGPLISSNRVDTNEAKTEKYSRYPFPGKVDSVIEKTLDDREYRVITFDVSDKLKRELRDAELQQVKNRY